MKFKKYRNEQELIDSIKVTKSGRLRKCDSKKLVDYACSLNERYNVPVDECVNYVKSLLEFKKQGLPIVTIYREEDAVDFVKPFSMEPRERTKGEMCGNYPESSIKTFVGDELLRAIGIFSEIPDKQVREFYINDTLDWFCEHYGVEKEYVVELLKSYLRNKRKTTMFKYSKLSGSKLNKIVGTEPDPDYRKYDAIRKNVQYEENDRDDEVK